MLLGVDPAKENTFIQDTAIRNLEQLSISDFKFIKEFSTDFTRIISQTGRAMEDELCDKYFVKFPSIDRRYQCNKCFKEICFLCIQKEFNIETEIIGRPLEKLEDNKDFYKERIDKHELAIELINQKLQLLEYRMNAGHEF